MEKPKSAGPCRIPKTLKIHTNSKTADTDDHWLTASHELGKFNLTTALVSGDRHIHVCL